MRVITGLRQEDALSPELFNRVLEKKIAREMNVSEGIELGQIKIRLLAYADDIALLEDDIETIKSGKKTYKRHGESGINH